MGIYVSVWMHQIDCDLHTSCCLRGIIVRRSEYVCIESEGVVLQIASKSALRFYQQI
jgi:hypothetical protein